MISAAAKAESGDQTAPDGSLVWQNFTQWFGGSQVVTADGEPLVVYHGTKSEFNTFDHKKIKGINEGPGFYFTDNKDIAIGYGEPMHVYLKLENPIPYDKAVFSNGTIKKIIKRVAEIESVEQGNSIGDGCLSNFGDVSYEGIDKVLNEAAKQVAEGSDTALDQISGIFGASGI